MFHKRLLKEFSDNRKYVAGMVIMQCANIGTASNLEFNALQALMM